MRATILPLVGAILLGLFLMPTTALAAPALALALAALPPGGTTTATGTGFAPGAKLELFIALPQFGGARVKMADLTAGADGGFTATVRLVGTIRPGPTPLVVVGDGADLAQATLTVTDAPSIATERLAVGPSTGPAGTRFAAVGTGLAPGQAVVLFTTESAKGPQGHFREIARLIVPADGRITVAIDSAGYSADGYDLIAFGPGGPQIGLPLVVAQFTVTEFTVTAPGMPGLPSTGGGGMASQTILVLALAVLGLAVIAGRGRRRAHRRG